MHPARSKPAGGFTLVEIVLAVGVFAFSIIGVVFLLGNALQSSTETQRDSALSSALTTTASALRTYDNPTVPKALFFDVRGSRIPSKLDANNVVVPDGTNAYYCFTPTKVTSEVLPNQEMYVVSVTAPYPATIVVGTFQVSHFVTAPPLP